MIDHKDILEGLKEAQATEKDNRKMVSQADDFLNKRDGQWEERVLQAWSNRPRYTFDQCNPVVDHIMAEMDSVDFAIGVDPAGGDATKKIANAYGGIMRNIENISSAPFVYSDAGRVMVGTGLSGWEIVQEHRDSDSFQQDLLIKGIGNFKERVFFDPNAVHRTMKDAMDGWKLSSMTMERYKETFPSGSGTSVGTNKESESYTQKRPNEVIIGEYYHREKETRTLVLLNNNTVMVKDEKFYAIIDEYRERGLDVKDERERDIFITHHRIFDGDDFLSEYKKTVFEYIPLVPVYANFGLSENKIIYWGAIEKLKDAQRVVNYAESKKAAESSLKPIEKVWMTKDQAKSPEVREGLETQNTNTDPVQLYDGVEGQSPPFKPPTNQPDGILIESAQAAQNYINRAAGLFDSNRGQGLANQAAETVKLLQNKGDSSNYKYFTAMEIALTHTCEILLKAIPKVYDTAQQMRIIGEDGTKDTFTIHEQVLDRDSGKMIEINDLSAGQYDATCSSGPAFKNKQQEMVNSIMELGGIDPSIIQLGKDVLLNNIPAPGMDKITERVRMQMLLGNLIPVNQQTEEEKAFVKENSQPKPPTPIEQANLGIAQAEMEKAKANTQETLSKIEARQQKMQLDAVAAQQKQQKMQMDYQLSQQKLQAERDKAMTDLILGQADQLKTQAETLNEIKQVIGADSVVGPELINTFNQQVDLVNDNQDNQTGT